MGRQPAQRCGFHFVLHLFAGEMGNQSSEDKYFFHITGYQPLTTLTRTPRVFAQPTVPAHSGPPTPFPTLPSVPQTCQAPSKALVQPFLSGMFSSHSLHDPALSLPLGLHFKHTSSESSYLGHSKCYYFIALTKTVNYFTYFST